MAFQPFGYKFEVSSPLPTNKAKAALRSRFKDWFDPKNGPRGWVIGPFLCIWTSAFDRHGPMVLARVLSHNFGTKIRGRAGSDLNGLIATVLWIPLMLFLALLMVRDGLELASMWMVGLVFLFVPIIFRFGHKDRRAADPLVHFVRRTIESPGLVSLDSKAARPVKLIVSGNEMTGVPSPGTVHEALCAMAPGDFLVLEDSDEVYLQTALKDDGFVIEKRDGSASRHYSGSKAAANAESPDSRLSADEIASAFEAYMMERPDPHWLRWKEMSL